MADDYTPMTDEVKVRFIHGCAPLTAEAESLFGERFDRWLAEMLAEHDAEKRAEWEAEQGETEWEYGCASSSHRRFAGSAVPLPWGVDPDEHGEECPSPALVRRRKAGAWLPVPDTGAEDEFAPGECDGSGTCTAAMHIHGCFTPHRSDQCDSPDEYGHIDTGAES